MFRLAGEASAVVYVGLDLKKPERLLCIIRNKYASCAWAVAEMQTTPALLAVIRVPVRRNRRNAFTIFDFRASE